MSRNRDEGLAERKRSRGRNEHQQGRDDRKPHRRSRAPLAAERHVGVQPAHRVQHAAQEPEAPVACPKPPQAVAAAKAKSRIMQRILVNDAEIRHLAEPWLQDLDDTLAGRTNRSLH